MTSRQDRPSIPTYLTLLGALWALVALGTLVTFWQAPYFFTLASPFRLHLVLALLVLGLPLALLYPNPRRWVFLALPLVVGATFLPYVLPTSASLSSPEDPQLRVAVANIHAGNSDLSNFSDWLDKERPDILAVMEVTPGHQAQIEQLPFAHKTILPRKGAFGMALLSQHDPDEVKILDEETPFPSILASWPEFRLLAVHPIPPISREARVIGDQQLARLIETLDDGSKPLMVVGDLNAVGWDLRLLPLRQARFVEARKGHGYLPTWPAHLPVLGIPIDHIFLPQSWVSLDCRRGPDIGSDHYPLTADVTWVRDTLQVIQTPSVPIATPEPTP